MKGKIDWMKNVLNKREVLVDIIYFIILCLCCFLHKFSLFSIISVICFISYFVVVLYTNGIFFIKYFYILFITVTPVISCAFIEFNSLYLQELQRNAGFTGALPLYTISYWVLIKTIMVVDRKNEVTKSDAKTIDYGKSKFVVGVSIAVFVLLLICFGKVLLHPAFIYRLERADYARLYGVTGVLLILLSYVNKLMIFPYLLVVSTKGRTRILGSLCIALNVLYFLWTGNKFGMFFQVLYLFLIVLSNEVVKRVTKEKLRKLIRNISLIFLALITMTLAIQSISYKGNIGSYFVQRISAQSQLWWNTYSVSGGELHVEEFGEEIKLNVTSDEKVEEMPGSNYGVYKQMYLALPRDYVDSYLSAGYRYTEAGFAAMYYYFGWIGPIVYGFFIGLFFALMINCFCASLARGRYIRAYIYIRLVLLGTTAFSMFIFAPFFSKTSCVLYLYLIITHKMDLIDLAKKYRDKWLNKVRNGK